MSYNIKKTNGEPLFGEAGLPENQVDTTRTPVALIGKLTPDYGNYQSENFVHITENFANDVFPENPLKGQFAYNTNDGCMYLCIDDILKTWTKILMIRFERSENPQTGDIYYDIEDKKLYIYDSTVGQYGDYILIGPDNYANKVKDATVLTTDIDIKSAYYNFNLNLDESNLVTLKIVAREKMNSSTNPEYGVRMPECASWIYKMLINSYKIDNTVIKTEIVGEPNYELIGRTNGQALNWTVTPKIFSNMLQINVQGIGSDNPLITPDMDKIYWEIDIENVKV